jgi:hypothetical protein
LALIFVVESDTCSCPVNLKRKARLMDETDGALLAACELMVITSKLGLAVILLVLKHTMLDIFFPEHGQCNVNLPKLLMHVLIVWEFVGLISFTLSTGRTG